MGWLISARVLPVCIIAVGLLLLWPALHVVRSMRVDRARDLFRLRREWLEAHFLSALGRLDPAERLRWEEAHWHDEIVWARDRQTRRLLALIGVHFDAESMSEFPGYPPRHATALFEYHKGRWHAEGKRIDEIRPDEAFLRLQRFEPVVLPQRRG